MSWESILKNLDEYWKAALLFQIEHYKRHPENLMPAYNYPALLLSEEITGKEFKEYMEHLAALHPADLEGTQEYYMVEPAQLALKKLKEKKL